jgi:hypothetical protein
MATTEFNRFRDLAVKRSPPPRNNRLSPEPDPDSLASDTDENDGKGGKRTGGLRAGPSGRAKTVYR